MFQEGRLPRLVECRENDTEVHETGERRVSGHFLRTDRKKLHGCRYFSTLDQSSGYWNIEVHPDSVHLLTFNTPFGRYAYKKLPFGLVSSQDVFQRAVDETFGDIPDVYCIADDVLIAARTREEHDMAVNRIIQRCRDSGFRLNPKKAKIL